LLSVKTLEPFGSLAPPNKASGPPEPYPEGMKGLSLGF
jgi:hypothetical protein